MELDLNNIRNYLADFRSRAKTIKYLVSKGADILEEILPLLEDQNEGVRWSAIRVLSEIKDKRAITPLIKLMEKGIDIYECYYALSNITGENLGLSVEAWKKRFLMGEKPIEYIVPQNDVEKLMERISSILNCKIQKKGNCCNIDIQINEDRTHRIWIYFDHKDIFDIPGILLCAICGQVTQDKYKWALQLNNQIPCGALSIVKLEDSEYLAVINSYPIEKACAEELADIIKKIAITADAIERMFFNVIEDIF